MNTQLWALAAAGTVVLAAAGLEAFRSARARRLAAGTTSAPSAEPYILYFTGDNCTVCRTHQEPALPNLASVLLDKVHARPDRALADHSHPHPLPTTLSLSSHPHV